MSNKSPLPFEQRSAVVTYLDANLQNVLALHHGKLCAHEIVKPRKTCRGPY